MDSCAKRSGGSAQSAAGGAVTAIDREARVVFRYPKIEWSWGERCIPKDKPELIEVMAGREYAGVYECFRDGIDRIIGLAPIHSIGWAVAAGRPLHEAMAPFDRQLAGQAGLFLLLTSAVFAISLTDLRPSILDDLGLLATIRWFLRQQRTIHPSTCVEEELAIEESDIPEPLKIVIFSSHFAHFNLSL